MGVWGRGREGGRERGRETDRQRQKDRDKDRERERERERERTLFDNADSNVPYHTTSLHASNWS